MAKSSSKLRSSSSFPNILLSCLNFLLFILSSSSLAPILLLKTPPTSLGYALLLSSSISIFSSIIGLYTHLTHLCFMTHLSFLFASLVSQFLSFFALFLNEKSSLSKLDSSRDPKEAKVLVRLECGVLMIMFVLQVLVLVMSCVVHRCWVKEHQEMEKMANQRSKRVAEIDEEVMENGAKVFEVKAKELDDKVKSKSGSQV
ncbi:Protein SEY1 [Bienertia sinuspersici]